MSNEDSNSYLSKLIKDSSRGASVTQDDLIHLGIILGRERASGTVPATGPINPETIGKTKEPGIMGSVQYSAIRPVIERDEAISVLRYIHQMMLEHKIVSISVALDPWGQPPSHSRPAQVPVEQ